MTETIATLVGRQRDRSLARRDVVLVAGLIILVVYPLAVPSYAVDLMGIALLFGIFAISLDLLWGYTGILNLGPAFSFGLGAYSWAIVTKRFEFVEPTIPALLVAVLLPALLALGVGYAAFRARTSDIYFALITLAVSLTLEKIAQVSYTFTGGSNGIINIPKPTLGVPGVFGVTLNDPITYYYFVLIITVVVVLFSLRLVASPFGRLLKAIRESEVRTETLGYSTLRYKLLISMISASLGGLAGALYVPVSGIAHPGLFGILMSIEVFVWVALGGQGTLIGPLIGAVLLRLAESFLASALVSYYLILMGVLFVVVVLFFPGGLMRLFDRLPTGIESDSNPASVVVGEKRT